MEAELRIQFPISEDLIEQVAQRVAEILDDKEISTPRKEYLTAAETAEMIPCSISKIYHLKQAGRIPYEKVGQQLCFKRSEIEEWKRQGGATTPA